ncbi:hypothetical protein NPIL_12591 [Nephila pilipes]|uniref:Uncharacterized protein n=1 Tax=Nephila pilipes TaxID=299642 RepID=A0A8X6R122_NEPPI|nr:hypothetical protein NPIL_12591 [Nephila pilipes]
MGMLRFSTDGALMSSEVFSAFEPEMEMVDLLPLYYFLHLSLLERIMATSIGMLLFPLMCSFGECDGAAVLVYFVLQRVPVPESQFDGRCFRVVVEGLSAFMGHFPS